MQRFAAKYTDAQRQAVVRAVVDENWTAPETVRAAVTGELPGAEARFVIPLSTVYWLARRERRRREYQAEQDRIATEPLADMVYGLTRSMLKTAELEAQRLYAQAQRDELDLNRLRRLIRCDQQLRKLVPADMPYEGLKELDDAATNLKSALAERGYRPAVG